MCLNGTQVPCEVPSLPNPTTVLVRLGLNPRPPVRQTGAFPTQLTRPCLGFVHTIPDSFCFRIGLLFTHKIGDFSVLSVTERSCAVPSSKVESHISDRCNKLINLKKLIRRKYLYKYFQMRHREKKQNKTIILLIIKIMNNYDNKNDKIR